MQLWWAIKPCHASCLFYYNQIKTGMLDRFENMISEYSEMEGLEIDRAASSNVVGYYRLPCTYNTTTKKYPYLVTEANISHKERAGVKMHRPFLCSVGEFNGFS